jgi:hypothetical protein
MKTLFIGLLLIASSVYSQELNYSWKAGGIYSFNANIADDITTSVMGMNVKEKYITTIDFSLAIQSVDAAGTATGNIYLFNYTVKDSKGLTVATIANVPKNAVQSAITVDKKGNFTFLKKVYLLTTPTSNMLVYGSADEGGMSAGAEMNGEKIDVYAEFDPKTGKLKAGYTVATLKTTKKVTPQANEESDELEVFPYDLLSLLALPDGKVAAGNTYSCKAGMYGVDIKVVSMSAGLAKINQTIVTDKSADMFSGSANGQTEEGSFDMEMSGMEDQMEMTPEDQAMMGMTKGMAPEMNGALTSSFNYTAGMFVSVGGKISTVIDMMGTKITVDSVVSLTKKP